MAYKKAKVILSGLAIAGYCFLAFPDVVAAHAAERRERDFLIYNGPLKYSRSKRSISQPPFTGTWVKSLLPNAEFKQEFLERHNWHRGNEKWARNIQCMEWDDTLANDAQALANFCHFDHIVPEGQGQNIYLITGDDYSPKTACDAWQAEIDWFEYNPNKPSTCSAPVGETCGHYTQLVWHDSKKIGCGAAHCTNTIYEDGTAVFPGFSSTIVVCNYSPPGNYINEPPYKRGSQCCECPAEKPNCVNGICCNGTATSTCNVGGVKPKERKKHEFFIKNQMHGKVVHVPSVEVAGTNVVMWHQHTKDSHQPNNTNQMWRVITAGDGWFYLLSSYSNGTKRLVLTLRECLEENCSERTKVSVNIKLTPPNKSQLFKYKEGKIISAIKSLVLHIPFKNDSDGAEIIAWYNKKSEADLNQKWIFEYPESFFYIKNKMHGKILAVKKNENDVVIWQQIKSDVEIGNGQLWRLIHCREDWYYFQSALSNETSAMVLSIQNCSSNCEGAELLAINEIRSPPSKNQMFKYKNGKILSAIGDLVVDIPWRKDEDGAIMQVWHNRHSKKDWNQRWILEYQ